VQDPSIAPQFDTFQGPEGLEHKMADRRLARDGIRLAFVDGEPAGFGVPWLLPQATSVWTMTRIGVLERFRRRGIGTRIGESLLDFARAGAPASGPIEVAGSAWLPSDAAVALATRLGFAHERYFWLMERARGGVPAPGFPADITVRTFDGTDAMLGEWLDVYNDSFSEHYRHVIARLDDIRPLVRVPGFRPDGVALAYRGTRCLGFVRTERLESRGEIAVLGTAHAARGIGLGRALLRWGVAWLEANSTTPVTPLVDGENEGALALYRSEGFSIAQTRQIWGRVLAGPA